MRKPVNIAPLGEGLSERLFAGIGYVFPAIIGALWVALPFHAFRVTSGMDTLLVSLVGAAFAVAVAHRWLWK